MTSLPLMDCGHTAQGTDGTGAPVCVICAGIKPGAREVAATVPDLTGRTARCSYYGSKCRSERESATSLAFFEHRPGEDHDKFYCGCFGWD